MFRLFSSVSLFVSSSCVSYWLRAFVWRVRWAYANKLILYVNELVTNAATNQLVPIAYRSTANTFIYLSTHEQRNRPRLQLWLKQLHEANSLQQWSRDLADRPMHQIIRSINWLNEIIARVPSPLNRQIHMMRRKRYNASCRFFLLIVISSVLSLLHPTQTSIT